MHKYETSKTSFVGRGILDAPFATQTPYPVESIGSTSIEKQQQNLANMEKSYPQNNTNERKNK